MLAQPREGTDGEGNTGCLSVRRHCVLTQSVVETDSQSLGGKPEERTAWVGVPAEDAVHHDEEVVGRLGLDGVAPDVDAAGGGLLGAHGWVVLLREGVEGAKRSLERGELVSRVVPSCLVRRRVKTARRILTTGRWNNYMRGKATCWDIPEWAGHV
jgi:hypothetical protein